MKSALALSINEFLCPIHWFPWHVPLTTHPSVIVGASTATEQAPSTCLRVLALQLMRARLDPLSILR